MARRAWTTLERERLRAMRCGELRMSLAMCARLLGRSYDSVAKAAQEWRIIVSERNVSAKMQRFRRLAKGGQLGVHEIARRTGWHRSTVTRLARLAGIALPNKRSAPRNHTVYVRPLDTLMQCFACPKRINPYKGVKQGWKTRPLPGRTNKSEREVYCPDCFARWGWPPVYGSREK